jgi:predicted RNA methylase
MSNVPHNSITTLREIAESLLDKTRPAYTLRDEVVQLRKIFETASGLTLDTAVDISEGETLTADGIAISPIMAAMCVDDFARTVTFMRGLQDAISEASQRVEGRVRVLYAGCGPWAPIAIPLMSADASKDAVFHLIDIHEQSIQSARRVISTLGLHDHVERLEVADARGYEIATPPDVIVVEMLRAGLEDEPQVVVAGHLIRQAPNAVLIPATITLDLVLVNSRREFAMNDELLDRDRIYVERVLTVDRDSLIAQGTHFAPTRVTIPDHDPLRYRAVICTTVQTFGDHILRDYDSGITCPRILNLAREIRPGDILELSYEINRRPGVRIRRIDPPS